MASAPAPPPPVIGKSGNLTVFITQAPSAEAASPSPGTESPGSEFSTPPTSPRAEDSPDSPTRPRAADLPDSRTSPCTEDSPDSPKSPRAADSPDQPTPEQAPATPTQVRTAFPVPLPDDTVSPTPQVRTASPPPLLDDTVSTPPLVWTVSPQPPAKLAQPPPPPPVQVPPPQYEQASAGKEGSVLTLFWDAVARVQEAHASLDEYISNWFGLDQSKYQWALNDYYERTEQEMDSVRGGNPKELTCKTEKV